MKFSKCKACNRIVFHIDSFFYTYRTSCSHRHFVALDKEEKNDKTYFFENLT